MAHVFIGFAKVVVDVRVPIIAIETLLEWQKVQSGLISLMMMLFLFSYNSTTKSLLSTLFLAHYCFLTMIHLRKLCPSLFCSYYVL